MYLFYNDNVAFSVDAYEPNTILRALSCTFSKTNYTSGEIAELPETHQKRRLAYSLTTHSHYDHAGGNGLLRELSPDTQVVCKDPAGPDRSIETLLEELPCRITCIDTPCHTRCSVCYLVEDRGSKRSWVLTGDFLFKLGCGRFFEGTAADFVESLDRLSRYCHNDTVLLYGHDYYKDNRRFACSVVPGCFIEAGEKELSEFFLRWEVERKYNPFINYRLVDKNGGRCEVIAALRSKKDVFI